MVCIQTTGIRRARRTSAPRRLRTTNVKGTKVSRETSLVMNMLPKKAQPDQYQCQLKGAVGAGQQCPSQSIKKGPAAAARP
mgnify:CR=1 FL=1